MKTKLFKTISLGRGLSVLRSPFSVLLIALAVVVGCKDDDVPTYQEYEIVLTSPDDGATIDMSQDATWRFGFNEVPTINEYVLMLSRQDDMTAPEEMLVTLNPQLLTTAELNTKASALGVETGKTTTLYWSVRPNSGASNIKTQVRSLQLTYATVPLPVLTSFTVTPNPLSLPEGGQPVQLTINKTPVEASGTFTFASNNAGVVTVNDAGLVTVVGQGSATITVSGEGDNGEVTPVEVPVTVLAPLNRRNWTATATSVHGDMVADRALDDNIDTEWHSGGSSLPDKPEIITVDMKGEKTITGFYFVHRQHPWQVGYPKEITIETRNDNSDWAQAWSNVGETGLPGVDADLKYIYRLPLASAITAQYFRINVVSTHRPDGNDHTYTYFAEVGAYNGAENPSETLVGKTPAHDNLNDPLTVKYVNADGSLVE